MNSKLYVHVARYGVAVLTVVLATAFRWLLSPVLGSGAPLGVYFVAVVLAAFAGGRGPTLIAVLLSALSAMYFFLPPPDAFWPVPREALFSLSVFVAFGVVTAVLSQRVRSQLGAAALERARLQEDNERLFRRLADSAPVLIWMAKEGGAATFFNQQWLSFSGRIIPQELGTGWLETVHVEDRHNALQAYLEAWHRGEAYETEFRLRRHDGEYRWVLNRGMPVRDSREQLTGFIGSCTDITDRKSSEDALRRSEARLASELKAMNRLQLLSSRLWIATDLQTALSEIMDAAMDLLEADSGAVQLYDNQQQALSVVVARGFDAAVVSSLDSLHFDGSACSRARRDLHRVIVEDVEYDAEFAPHRSAAAEAGFRAVQATPLISRSGELLGMLSTHFRQPHRPSEQQLRMLDLYVRLAADLIERLQAIETLRRVHEEKEAALRSLQKSEEQFRLLSNSISQLAWMAAPDGDVFWYNDRWFEYTGTTPGDMKESGWTAVHDAEELPRVLSSWKKALDTGEPWEETFPLRRSDGEMRWHLTRALPLKDEQGRVVRWFGTNTDISERRRTERTLRFLADASQALATLQDYKSTLQRMAWVAVPDFADWCSVDVVGDDGALQRVAVAHRDIEKVQLAEQLYALRPPQEDDLYGAAAVLRTGQSQLVKDIPPNHLQQTIDDPDMLQAVSAWNLKSMICAPLKTQDRLYGVLSFATDESGRQFDENDLKVGEDLARRAAIAIENTMLYQRLREADRRKDEFLAMLAHELRNPLAPIRTGLDILGMQDEQPREVIASMQQQVEHLVRLVDDLLDASRIMRGKVELRKERVSVASLVQQAAEAVRAAVGEQRQTLSIQLPDEPLWLDADPIRLVQVLLNLLHNASKYTDPSGHIQLGVARQNDYVVITVRDDGIGIEEELLNRVFDLFTQSSRSLDRAQGGLGIGLTLVKNLVQMHDGTVSAYSEGPGTGSEFRVRLPLAEAPALLPTRVMAPAAKPGSRRILVVDDNMAVARMLTLLLGKLGDHEIATAHDGHAALEKVQQFRPDLTFLDIGLPGLDGYEVGKQIRANAALNRMLLVALTGYGQEEDRQRSLEAGFDEHMVKPLGIDDLQQLLVHPKLAEKLEA